MSSAILITIGETDIDNGIMADNFVEAFILVGRLIERLCNDDFYKNKYIYVSECFRSDNGKYLKQDDLFNGKYIIEN
jgi:hypothetical protein